MCGYKLVVMLKSGIKKDKKEKLFSDIQKWVGDVKVTKTTELGEKRLAYPVKGAKSAEYVLFEFEGEKLDITAERRIVMNDEVVRHLMVRVN